MTPDHKVQWKWDAKRNEWVGECKTQDNPAAGGDIEGWLVSAMWLDPTDDITQRGPEWEI